jgi:hypothetical protein
MPKIIREPLLRWRADILKKEIIAGALALFWMSQASFRSAGTVFQDTHLPMRTHAKRNAQRRSKVT